MPRKLITDRQREILILAAHGYTNTSIARMLGIHPSTVQNHLTTLFRRLGAHDRAHAVTIALYHGLITMADLRTADLQMPAPDMKEAA